MVKKVCTFQEFIKLDEIEPPPPPMLLRCSHWHNPHLHCSLVLGEFIRLWYRTRLLTASHTLLCYVCLAALSYIMTVAADICA